MRPALEIGIAAVALGIGCAADPTGPGEVPEIVRWDGLAFRAEVRLEGEVPGEVVAGVTVYNPGIRTRRLEYGFCALELRAYGDATRRGDAVWSSREFQRICLLYLANTDLAPGQSLRAPEFTLRIPVHEIVGEGSTIGRRVAEGRYWFTAVLELNDGRTPEIAAGDAVLALDAPD